MSQQYIEPEYEAPAAYRIVKFIAWVLVALGLLEWFVLGANRPVDPVVSPTAGLMLPFVAVRLVAGRLSR